MTKNKQNMESIDDFKLDELPEADLIEIRDALLDAMAEQESLNEDFDDEEETRVKAETPFTFIFEPVGLYSDEVDEITDSKEYKKGQAEVSRIAGMFSTMISFGIPLETVIEYIMNNQAFEHNQKMQKMGTDGQIKTAQAQAGAIDNNSL